MSNVVHRNLNQVPPVAVGGDGPYLIDDKGKRYLDASGGAAVSCLGHSHTNVIEALQQQAGKLAYAHTGFFTSESAEQLASLLAKQSPGDLNHIYYCNSGSEAMEAAIKLARQYHVERGETQRDTVIARRQSYHGVTVGGLSVGGHVSRKAPFLPLLMNVRHISPCFPYHYQLPQESDSAYALRLAKELEQTILEVGAHKIMAFVAETVVGATGGAIAAVPDYFKLLREVCDRYDVLLILDEVMCGMGRTGSLFACEQENIVPDIVAVAKGLGAGYQPIGAMLMREKIYRTIAQGTGVFMHSQTYMGHPMACAAALAVQETIINDNLLENVRHQGGALHHALKERFSDHSHIGDIRGRGLFWALELVADKEAKSSFDPGLKIHARLKKQALALGLMVYPAGGTIDGNKGDHVLLAPPFIINENHIQELISKLSQTVDSVMNDVIDQTMLKSANQPSQVY